MKWLGIALVLYFLIYGFIEEAKERLSGYDDNDNYDYDEDWNKINSAPPSEFHHKDTNEYSMLVRVRGDKYARQEEITIEAHNIFEARQKAKNMGYDIIRS